MCGRYVVVSEIKTIEDRFDAGFTNPDEFRPHVNIGPGFKAPIIASDEPSKIKLATFGLTPHWSKKRMYLFNARAEGDSNKENRTDFRGSMGIVSKPSFRKPIRSQRCLVIADAYIEGPEKEKLSKPYLVYPEKQNRPFAFAGIYDDWADRETGEIIRSFSIITSHSNRVTQAIGHHRAPIILDPTQEQLWLNRNVELESVVDVLRRSLPFDMNAHLVSSDIKNPRSSGLQLLRPLAEPIMNKISFEVAQGQGLVGMGHSTARQRRIFEDD